MKVKSVQDRLLRGEDPESVRAVAETFSEDTLTLGFARRIATYKRLFLLTYDPERVRRIFADGPPLQMVVAGKAHPLDENAKQMLVDVFGLSNSVGITSRVAFLENYDLAVAAPIVGGCDVWLNVPRPPLEASGTSGMKSAANGGLNLSVLDGWWVEGYDGENGWEIDGTGAEGEDEAAQDARHAHALYDLLEQQVIPLFHDRDADGIPRRWLQMVKRHCGRTARASRPRGWSRSTWSGSIRLGEAVPPRSSRRTGRRYDSPSGSEARASRLRAGRRGVVPSCHVPVRQAADEQHQQDEERGAGPQHGVERAGHVADGAEDEG